jgi:DNA-binding SARP family transcriptional activator
MQILAFLAVNRDGATSGQLAAALWPGLRPHAATRRLYTPIGVLRATLHKATGTDVIVRDGERYRLDDQHIDVDLWRLHTAVEHAATALQPTDRQRALHTVIDTYTGELAAGQKWPWLAPHREATRRHVVDAYAALAATQPHPTAALTLLQDAIRTDPFNEDLHRRAMRGYAAAGDPTAARQLLAGLTGRLTDAGIQPGDDVRQFATEMDA